jgi:hypothetical protein
VSRGEDVLRALAGPNPRSHLVFGTQNWCIWVHRTAIKHLIVLSSTELP